MSALWNRATTLPRAQGIAAPYLPGNAYGDLPGKMFQERCGADQRLGVGDLVIYLGINGLII